MTKMTVQLDTHERCMSADLIQSYANNVGLAVYRKQKATFIKSLMDIISNNIYSRGSFCFFLKHSLWTRRFMMMCRNVWNISQPFKRFKHGMTF